jgi:hypothetical protein
MAQQVIEGTWEEIKRHEAELAGQFLRVTFDPEGTAARQPSVRTKGVRKVKVARARGMLAGLLSTEDYFSQKREDTIREDRVL